MAPPARLPDVKPGDDLIKAHVALRRSYASETGKYRRLQAYVAAITGKK
jgi:hypothetical protein